MTRIKHILTFSFFVLFFASLPAPVSGRTTGAHLVYTPILFSPQTGPPVWIGPDGGSIIAISMAASQPSTVYVGTWGSGIYKSSDSGKTWVWKSQGLGHRYLNSLAVDPGNPQIVYAGTHTGKLYKSLDGGENWFPSGNHIQDQAVVYSIAIDPLDSENLFIGTRGKSNNGGPPWNGVLYRSTDAGNTWEPKLVDVGGPSQEDWAYSVTLHPRFPHLVYAATHEHGIYRSLNNGKHWAPVNDGITSLSTRAIVVDPNSSETSPILYTGVWKWQGVFRSNNGGESWFVAGNGSKDTRIFSMSIDPQDGDNVFASTFSGGVLKTSNGGASWKISGLENQEVAMTAVDPQNPQQLYAGTNSGGLFKSVDSGKSWGRSQAGLHATNVSATQISPDNSQRIYVGLSGDGVKHSGDGGLSWKRLGTDLGDPEILGLVMSPSNPRVLLALTETDGLYRCEIRGTCWQKIDIDYPKTSLAAFDPGHPFWRPPLLDDGFKAPAALTGKPALLALRFAPSDPQIAYLGTSGAGVYKSIDGGDTWRAAGLSGMKIVSLAVDGSDPERVFAAGGTRVWDSKDGGISWIDTGLGGVEIYALAADRFGNRYAGTSDGIYQRTPSGWRHLGLEGSPVPTVATHPDRAGWLYAGTQDGLRISRNDGRSWVNGPMALEDITIRSITFDPADPSRLYISTVTQGVLRMQDWK